MCLFVVVVVVVCEIASFHQANVVSPSGKRRSRFPVCPGGSGVMTRPPWSPYHTLPVEPLAKLLQKLTAGLSSAIKRVELKRVFISVAAALKFLWFKQDFL